MRSKPQKLKDKIIGTFVSELRQSEYYQSNFKSALNECLKELNGRKIGQIVCYGLGSFSNPMNADSRYQLALLVLLHERLTALEFPIDSVIEIYDPDFRLKDIDTLSIFTTPQFKIIRENEYCGRQVNTLNSDKCLLFYMPHMDENFYNNLIGANWTADRLGRLVVFGNSFQIIMDKAHPKRREEELYYLNQLVENFSTDSIIPSKSKKRKRSARKSQPPKQADTMQVDRVLFEFPVDDTSFGRGVFNSLSFHILNDSWLLDNPSVIEKRRMKMWELYKYCESSEDPFAAWD